MGDTASVATKSFTCFALPRMLKIAAVLLFTVVAYATAQVAPIVPEDCLGCLCQASTGCNMTMSCTGGSQYLCGPFLISWPYWADGGKFVLTDDDPQRLGGKSSIHFLVLSFPSFIFFLLFSSNQSHF